MKILHYPHPLLLRRTQKVDEIGGNLAEIAQRMFAIMYEANGLGLSANQAGLDLRMCVINATRKPEDEIVMINPEIVARSGSQNGEEGCLSFPNVFGKIARNREVTVEFHDLKGKLRVLQAIDLMARVCQHEIDHLDGVVFVVRMSAGDRTVNLGRLKEMESNFAGQKR